MASAASGIINSKRFLLFMICLFLFPFFLLSAWNHPSLDDFTLGIVSKTHSFWDIQSHFYLHWSGRYIATLMATIFVTSGILYSYYYLFAALFLVCTFFAFLFALHQLNRYILEKKFSKTELAIFSAILLILELHVIPEIKTQFYWFSGSMTYQAPLILLVLLAGFILRLFYVRGSKAFNVLMILILDFMLNGFNEMIS